MEYPECVDCDDSFFGECKCEFEDESSNNQISVERDVIDYNIFVLNQQNLQKEIANILVVDGQEKPQAVSRRIDNLVAMYMKFVHNENKATENHFKYFQPVVSLRKYIDTTSKPETLCIEYNVDDYEEDTIENFIQNKALSSVHKAFMPFKITGKENKIITRDTDAIHATLVQGMFDKKQHIRLLQSDNVKLVGFANIFNMQDSMSNVSSVSLEEYFSFLKNIKEGAAVDLIPHDNVPGLDHNARGIVINNKQNKLLIKSENGNTYAIDTSSISNAISSSFSLKPQGFKDHLFCKYDFFKGPYIATLEDPRIIPALFPSVSEWLYVHGQLADKLFSLQDALVMFGHNMHPSKEFEPQVKSIINKNITREKTKVRNRKTFKLVKRIYKTKQWPVFLDIVDYPYAKSSTDLPHARMLYLSKGEKLQTQLLQCVKKDWEVESVSDLVDAAQHISNKVLKVALDNFVNHIHELYNNIFTSFDELWSKKPDNNDKACIWNVHTRMFCCLKPLTAFHQTIWSVDIDKTKDLVRLFPDLSFEESTLTITLKKQSNNVFNDLVQHSVNEALKQKRKLKLLAMDLAKTKRQLDNSFTTPSELSVINVHGMVTMEGDDDYVNYQEMLENKEFGQVLDVLEVDKDEFSFESEEVHEAHSTPNIEGPLFDLCKRFTDMLGMHFSDQQYTFIMSQCNIHTKYTDLLATFQSGVKERDKQLIALVGKLSSDKLDALKVKLTNNLESKKNELLYSAHQTLAFLLPALGIIIIQQELPNIIIDPMPEYAKVFSVGGYPMSEDTTSKKTLLSYVAHLLRYVASSMGEFSFLTRESLDDCTSKIQSWIDKILLSSTILKEKLLKANQRYIEFKNSHTLLQNLVSTYGIWDTFRPYPRVKDVEYNGKDNITTMTAKYISLIQKAVESSHPVKIGVDNRPMFINSCCIEPYDHNINYWNYFSSKPEIKYHLNYINTILSKHAPTGNYVTSVMYTKEVSRVTDLFEKEFVNIQSDIIEHTNFQGNQVTSHENTLIYDCLMQYTRANPIFSNDTALTKILNFPVSKSAWDDLSIDTFNLFDNIGKLNPDTVSTINTIKNLLISADDDSVLANTLTSFLSYDLKSILGKIGNNYRLHGMKRKSNLPEATPEAKKSLLDATAESIPGNLLSVYARTDSQELRSLLKMACLHGLQGVNILSKLVKVVKEKTRVNFLLSYILATILSHPLSKNIDNGVINVGLATVQNVLEVLIKKYNKNLAISEAANYFEKQREDGKQQVISMMKMMSSGDRDLIKELKERSLVDLQNMAANNVFHAMQVQVEDNGQVNERDKEIIEDILQYQGENADVDVDDD